MEYTESLWMGYKCAEFEFDGTPAKVVIPNCKPNGKWAYKTEYFGAFPEVEVELLKRGWHIAYNKNFNRWAEPADLQRKIEFIHTVSREFELEDRCALVGMSCGGMYAVKLCALAPELISVLYLDAPVINLLSCPFKLGIGKLDLRDEYFAATGRGVSEMLSYRDHPLDKLPVLTDNSIPVVLVCGDSDGVVPYEENGALVAEHYRRSGGVLELYIKPGCDHHPHGLEDPTPIVEFIEKHS